MKLPFDLTRIDQTIDRYNESLHIIIKEPLLTFEELMRIEGKLRGIYLVFEPEELVYVGKTNNIRTRLKDMTSSKMRHSLFQILLDIEMGDLIFKATGYTFLNDNIRNAMFAHGVLTKQEFNKYKRRVKEKIKAFKFKFYATDLYNMQDLVHFAIAVLNPVYNQ